MNAAPADDGVYMIAAFYVLAADAPGGTVGVLRALAGGWPRHQRPSWWQPLPSLPRTATGKLTRRKLAQLALGRALAPDPCALEPGPRS